MEDEGVLRIILLMKIEDLLKQSITMKEMLEIIRRTRARELMKKRICLDIGSLTLYFTKDEPEEIKQLMKGIKDREVEHVIKPTLIEIYNHLCRAKGKLFAGEASLITLQTQYSIKRKSLTNNIILKAGELKYQYRRILSHLDCLVIACILNEKPVLHITEKSFPKISNLKLEKYNF